ncbi:MAG: decarboxylating 6-phosphogluconate dehydrogenase [Actinomycetia bacterium]|nr:decarboxylating 6-phosphogluconate dehydrogenase [Actinomycetes bacterium]
MKELGFIGLGKMGYNMVLRLLENNYRVVVFDQDLKPGIELEACGAINSRSLEEMITRLRQPAVLWLMLPHNETGGMISELSNFLEKGSTIIDGGNSWWKNSQKNYDFLSRKGINFIDVGVSGGPSGARNGACLMAGAAARTFQDQKQLLNTLAGFQACRHVGKPGAGHFAKMIHNGIEYGMMQSLAEGFNLLSESEFDFDLKQIADLYNHDSVIKSRLVAWLQDAFQKFGNDLENVSSRVGHSGEGQWAVEYARVKKIKIPSIESALNFRKDKTDGFNFTKKILSALRNRFGGHPAIRRRNDE